MASWSAETVRLRSRECAPVGNPQSVTNLLHLRFVLSPSAKGKLFVLFRLSRESSAFVLKAYANMSSC